MLASFAQVLFEASDGMTTNPPWIHHWTVPKRVSQFLAFSLCEKTNSQLFCLKCRYVVGLVMLFRGENGNEHCSWCHYLSCVPTKKWKCNNTSWWGSPHLKFNFHTLTYILFLVLWYVIISLWCTVCFVNTWDFLVCVEPGDSNVHLIQAVFTLYTCDLFFIQRWISFLLSRDCL